MLVQRVTFGSCYTVCVAVQINFNNIIKMSIKMLVERSETEIVAKHMTVTVLC